MGGKQKRAAKFKKWIESQNHLKQLKEKEKERLEELEIGNGKLCYNTAETFADDQTSADCQRMPMKVRQEFMRHRLKKLRKQKSTRDNWLIRYFTESDLDWVTWLAALFLKLLILIACFFVIRFLIQLFVTSDTLSSGGSPLYYSLRAALPEPVFKLVLMVDYIFCSKDPTIGGLEKIMYYPTNLKS